MNNVQYQLFSQLNVKLYNQLRNQLHSQLYNQLRNQLHSQLNDLLREDQLIDHQLNVQLREDHE